jgi:molecular chaperone GrpE (heat shock protein)
MSDDDNGDDGEAEITIDALRERLSAIESQLDEAETEIDLDEVESELNALETDLEAADLPDPDDEDEDPPEEEIEDEKEDLEEQLEEARGPYDEDVVEEIEAAIDEIQSAEWTETGLDGVETAIETFVGSVNDELDSSVELAADPEIEDFVATLEEAAETIEAAGLDADDDAEAIGTLLDAAEQLVDDLDAAETWDDLSVREKLDHHGFYDVLDHRKDFPPEWHALKVFEKRGDVDKILIALDMLDSDFMEEHCLEALERMGREEAVEPMMERAQKRDQDAIRILGKTGSDEPVEMLLEYIEGDGNPGLQKVVIKALGEIGSEEATQGVAQKLDSDNEDLRSRGARALGLIGDTRAVDPLADVLAEDDSDTVRASAAWALNQIGTEDALEEVSQYSDDRAYLVQAEAEKAV